MRSAEVLALLLCAGQVIALPVNSPMNKGDTEVMKCIVEVISDTLSKPSPMPVSQECSETLRGDERILSILRHQNLLRELQNLALQGAKERARQQKKQSSAEDALPEVLEEQSDQAPLKDGTAVAPPEEAAEKRGASEEMQTEGGRPQASPGPAQGSRDQDGQTPGEEETPHNYAPAGRGHPEPQAEGHSEEHSQGPASTEQAQREEEEEEAEETGEKARPEEEDPTTALSTPPSKDSLSREGGPEAPAVDDAERTEAEGVRPPKRKGSREHSQQQRQEQEEEELAGASRTLFPGGQSRQLEPQEEEDEEEPGQRPKQWAGAKRWSKMDRLAQELAEKRLERADEELAQPDGSMKLPPFRAPAYALRGPGPARGWSPTSQEDSMEAGLPLRARGFPEEKKEEEGSANRRAEDQELESLSAIEAELEKVARELEALRRG